MILAVWLPLFAGFDASAGRPDIHSAIRAEAGIIFDELAASRAFLGKTDSIAFLDIFRTRCIDNTCCSPFTVNQ